MVRFNKAPDFCSKKSIISDILLPFSYLYQFGGFLRHQFAKPFRSKHFVICVGNIIAGGSGKTPITLAIAKYLRDNGYDVTIICKGYGGSKKGVYFADNSLTPQETGDEPQIIMQEFPCLIANDIKKGLQFLEGIQTSDCHPSESWDPDEKKMDSSIRWNDKSIQVDDRKIIITDDGMQNPHFHKDFLIMVVDKERGFANGRLLPAGLLREYPQQAMQRANAIILTGNGNFEIEQHQEKIFHSTIKILNPPAKEEKYLAFAGLGNNQKFFASLEKMELSIIEKISFPDHYAYSNKDEENLIALASKNQAKLICTMKDYVKLSSNIQKQCYVINIEAEIENIKNLLDLTKL